MSLLSSLRLPFISPLPIHSTSTFSNILPFDKENSSPSALANSSSPRFTSPQSFTISRSHRQRGTPMRASSSKRELRGYNGGEPRYRASRLRAAMACSRFNALPEDCSPSERAAAWRDVICPRDRMDESRNSLPKEKNPCSSPPPLTTVSASPATPPLTPASDPPQSSPSALPGSGSQPCADAPRVPRVPRVALPKFPDQSQSRSSDPAATARANSSGSGTGSGTGTGSPSSAHSAENLYPAHHGPYIKAPIYVDYGLNVHIGRSSFINRNCHILDSPVASLVIGERCLFGPNVHLYNVTHTLDARKRTDPSYDASSLAGNIRIGDDCWIGGGAIILPGVTIGNGACIGAGSVVTRDIPAHHLAVGVPARVVRRLDRNKADDPCSGLQDQIKQLLGIGSAASRSGDIGGIRSAKAGIKKLEVLSVVLTMLVLWLLYREAFRESGRAGG